MTFDEVIKQLPVTAQELITAANNYGSRKHLDFKTKECITASEEHPYSVYFPEFTAVSGICPVVGASGIFRESTPECPDGKHIVLFDFDNSNVGEIYISPIISSATPYLSFYETKPNNKNIKKVHNCPRDNKLKQNETLIWVWNPNTGLIEIT